MFVKSTHLRIQIHVVLVQVQGAGVLSQGQATSARLLLRRIVKQVRSCGIQHIVQVDAPVVRIMPKLEPIPVTISVLK